MILKPGILSAPNQRVTVIAATDQRTTSGPADDYSSAQKGRRHDRTPDPQNLKDPLTAGAVQT